MIPEKVYTVWEVSFKSSGDTWYEVILEKNFYQTYRIKDLEEVIENTPLPFYKTL